MRLRATVTSAPITGRKAESATRTPIIANIIVHATGSVLPASGRVPFCACEFGEEAEDNAAAGEPGWFRLSVGSVPESAIGALLVRLRATLQQLQRPD